MSTHKPTELSRIKLKTWTEQPVPMLSEHSAHLTSLRIGFRTWVWRYTHLLLMSMLWHRQATFESKRDKVVFLCWLQDSKLVSLRHQFGSKLNAHSQTDWAIEDQAKNLNSTAHPRDFTADWLSHLALAIYTLVNFDALAQASGLRIERRQVVFLCWMQDSKLGSLRHQFASRLNAHSQTDWAIEDPAWIA